jgi:hypothetical protein
MINRQRSTVNGQRSTVNGQRSTVNRKSMADGRWQMAEEIHDGGSPGVESPPISSEHLSTIKETKTAIGHPPSTIDTVIGHRFLTPGQEFPYFYVSTNHLFYYHYYEKILHLLFLPVGSSSI